MSDTKACKRCGKDIKDAWALAKLRGLCNKCNEIWYGKDRTELSLERLIDENNGELPKRVVVLDPEPDYEDIREFQIQ